MQQNVIQLIPLEYFWIADNGRLRVARNVRQRGDLLLIDVFRNPDDVYVDRAMFRSAEYRLA